MWRLGAMADEGRGLETKEISFGGCVLAWLVVTGRWRKLKKENCGCGFWTQEWRWLLLVEQAIHEVVEAWLRLG
jgi:hypothetical protein